MQWAYNWMLQACLHSEDPPSLPPPSSASSTATPVPTSCVGVTPSQLETALSAQTDTIQAMLTALKTDILNVVATNTALHSSTNEILTAIADISCGGSTTPTPPPDPNAGYAVVNGTQYAKLQDAANAVPTGGTVTIHGEMRDQNATAGFARSCTIIGTAGAKLTWTLGTTVNMALGKGLIVCSGLGQTYLVDGIELTGARVASLNGAGVRGDGAAQITVQNCNIHDNENGVLSIANIQFYYGNTFKNNGNGAGNTHGIYVSSGNVAEVTAEGNTFYANREGNQFKSRAKKNTFRRNMVAELDGACSWQVDMSNGGDVLIEKNVIEQGPNAANRNLVSYAPEGLLADGRINALAFRDNILINDHSLEAWGLDIRNQPATVELVRNTFVGLFAAHVVNGTLDGTNLIYADRAAAGYAAYPFLPGVPV